MSAWVMAGISVFGGLGALARFIQDTLVKSALRDVGWASCGLRSGFPWGTVSVNVVGSFLLGGITGLAAFAGEPEHWKIVLSAGFCAGYTTFSTAMFDVVAFARDGRWREGLVNLIGTVVLALAAAALGFWVASLW